MPNAISRFFRWAYSLLRKGNNYYDYGVIALQQRINDDVMVPLKTYYNFRKKSTYIATFLATFFIIYPFF